VRRWLVIVGLALVLAACAPAVDGPVERQRASDRADGDQLAAQLAALPGVVRAQVVLRHAARDPLATAPPSPAGVSVVVIVDDQADRAAITETARRLARTAAPALEPTIVVEVGAIRPTLAKVGPFTVEAASKGPLRGVLGVALAVIAALAGWIAWRERQRRGNSAQ
jgi:type III secretory pathway lipoprotein EscJ